MRSHLMASGASGLAVSATSSIRRLDGSRLRPEAFVDEYEPRGGITRPPDLGTTRAPGNVARLLAPPPVNTGRILTPWHRVKIDPPCQVLVTLRRR